MNNRQNQEETIFHAALQLTAEKREAYLNLACEGDEALRSRVQVLLEAEAEADPFFRKGPIQVASGESVQEQPTEVGAPTPEQLGTTIGRYKLLQKIGEGGCGVVYMAEQEQPVRRRVALKVIKAGMDTKSVVARFEAERQALAMMDHPNIAKVLDGGDTASAGSEISNSKSQISGGRPYFVMELVRGIKITEYCDENNLSTRDRLGLFTEVCQAIQHAHQKGIIHRDIKPSNVLVTVNDGRPVPKVIDFGIAKATEQRLTDKTLFTAFEQFIGTPAYMSPEQAGMTSLDIDTRSDIYSLGVLLYELLAGSTPFDAKELMASGFDAMRKTIREQEPVRPSTRLTQALVAAEVTRRTIKGAEESASSRRRLQELVHQLKGDLDWIVMKCLEKDRTRRYETANGLAADLKRHLNNEPVLARPPSPAYKFQKAFRRNKLVFTAGTAIVVALVLGVIGTGTGLLRAEKQRQTAQQKQAEAEAERRRAETEQQRADSQARKASESQQQSRRLLYASDMNLAQQSLKLNNLGKARRLLDRHRPQPGEEDLRGWEWRYLWQLTRSSALVTLTNRPTTRGFDVSFSPDSTRLAVGWWDGRVDLWDVPGRQRVRALTDRESPQQGRVAFSPVRNLLAATSEPKVVSLYDLDSGRDIKLWRAPDPGAWNVRDLAFSPDGSKLVIYAGISSELGDAVWVVNVASAQIESRLMTAISWNEFFGAARLSSDNHRLYLSHADISNYRYRIECRDLTTGQKIWETESQRDLGLSALALSPDGRLLASGSGFEDPTIRIWDAATGQPLFRLDGHTAWVCKLAFTRDGRRLISASTDQSIRFWATSTWNETKVLRGHSDEVHAVAISKSAQLVASAGKDGNLMLWKEDGKDAADGYSRLPEDLRAHQVLVLDPSRVLLLSSGRPPELVDLKRDSLPMPLPQIGSSSNVLGAFGSNIICDWNGTNQILVRELRGAEFIHRGTIALDSGMRPSGFAYNPTRQLLTWSEGFSSTSVYLAGLAAPGRRIELKSDVAGMVYFRFSEDGNHLAAANANGDSLRIWNIETGQIVASLGGVIRSVAFAARGRVLVVVIETGNDHEILFYDLIHPDRAPGRVPGRSFSRTLAVSSDGGLVASSTDGGQVRLFDPAKGELIETIHGHLNAAFGIAFSPDGRRLISASGGRETVKLWDVGTRQELLTLVGTGSFLQTATWSADGDLILAGAPWQAWRAPSWEEIAAAEAKEKTAIKQP